MLARIEGVGLCEGGAVKVAVVTGASQGIGKAIAEALRADGWAVENFSLPRDVRSYKQCEDFMRDMGEINLLVNNAAICKLTAFNALMPNEWHETIDINLTGVFNMSHAAINHIHNGDIINISSRAGVYAHPNHAAYCASKAAVMSLSEVMSMDLRKFGIRVGYIMPGVVATRLAGIEPQEWFLQPSDVADTVMAMVNLPRRASLGRVEIKPSFQPFK
jgi:3-oxoacyl-[acyl-carrier protein] reductase